MNDSFISQLKILYNVLHFENLKFYFDTDVEMKHIKSQNSFHTLNIDNLQSQLCLVFDEYQIAYLHHL